MAKGKLPVSYRARQSESTDVEAYFREVQFPAPAPAAEKTTLSLVPSKETFAEDFLFPSAASAGAAVSAPPAVTAPPAVSLRTRPIHHCVIAQHGHSSNDQLVYQLLWGQGILELQSKTSERRIVTMGVGRIAKLTGTIHERNVTIILRRLIAKQSIEIVREEVSARSVARQYRVFSYEEILDRRRKLGLEWVTRSSRGVEFVDPKTGEFLAAQTAPPAVSASPAVVSSGDIQPPGTPAVTSRPPPAVISGPLGKRERKEERTTTTLLPLLQAQLSTFDDTAVKQLWADCNRQVPDVTPEEVAILFASKLAGSRSRGIESPNGFLLRAVAASCTRAAIGALRQGREVSPATESTGVNREYWEALLANPDATEAMRSCAREQIRTLDD